MSIDRGRRPGHADRRIEQEVTKLRLRRVTADETTFVEWVGQFDVADADEAEVCNSVMSLYHEGLEALRVRFVAS